MLGNLITGLCCLRIDRVFRFVGYVLLMWALTGLVLFANEFMHKEALNLFASYFNAIYQPLAWGIIAVALFRASRISLSNKIL